MSGVTPGFYSRITPCRVRGNIQDGGNRTQHQLYTRQTPDPLYYQSGSKKMTVLNVLYAVITPRTCIDIILTRSTRKSNDAVISSLLKLHNKQHASIYFLGTHFLQPPRGAQGPWRTSPSGSLPARAAVHYKGLKMQFCSVQASACPHPPPLLVLNARGPQLSSSGFLCLVPVDVSPTRLSQIQVSSLGTAGLLISDHTFQRCISLLSTGDSSRAV